MSVDNIVLLKLISGEEVVAYRDPEVTEDEYCLSKIRKLVLTHTPQGTTVSMMPWLIGVQNPEEEFFVATQSVLQDLTEHINSDLKNMYYESTTGIALSGHVHGPDCNH